MYFTGRAARRASNTAIDFTHVATNNHALPYGLSEPIAITNIKNAMLERPQMHAPHEASGRGPAAKCSQDSPGEPRCTRCAAELKLKARRHCRPRRRKQSRNPLRIAGTIAIGKIQKYSVRGAAHSRRSRFQQISGHAACADAPCVTRSSPEGADFMAGRVHAVDGDTGSPSKRNHAFALFAFGT